MTVYAVLLNNRTQGIAETRERAQSLLEQLQAKYPRHTVTNLYVKAFVLGELL